LRATRFGAAAIAIATGLALTAASRIRLALYAQPILDIIHTLNLFSHFFGHPLLVAVRDGSLKGDFAALYIYLDVCRIHITVPCQMVINFFLDAVI